MAIGQATDANKTCNRCKATKPVAEFPMNRTYRGRRYPHGTCRACRREQCRQWSKTDRGKQVKRAGILRRQYRISEAEYAAMLERQGGVCAICRKPETFTNRRAAPVTCQLAVDHDHATGTVRGLLCSACNVGIGNFGDDPDRLRIAAAYLESCSCRAAAV